mgnify:CR=1 FL=1
MTNDRWHIEKFVNERENYYFKIFNQNDIKAFVKEANSFITLHNEFNTPEVKLIKTGQALNKEKWFKNRCARISLGIAVELLIKATYLKQGYLINKTKTNGKQKLCKIGTVLTSNLMKNTHDFKFLITHLDMVLPTNEYDFDKDIRQGLEIARIWRNVNAHVVIGKHIKYGGDYYSITKALGLINNLVLHDVKLD